MELIVNPTEQRELAEKRAALQQLEDELAERETELSLLQSGVREFELGYLETLGNKYDELADIEKRINEVQGAHEADDDYTVSNDLECGQTKFHVAENLKKIVPRSRAPVSSRFSQQ